ncbi:MAG: maleylpyruvate isomerase N-terminal domain-containing protein, partial [Frankiales bacterium]|nr:maleylpyruvate isomerase N-terminal domain-containing protein [Frankiales bacterium]
MTTLTAPVATAPRRPALDRATAMRLAATEYARVTDALRELDPHEWTLSTCNTGWDVRAMAGHTLGMAHMSASLLEQARQMREARRRGGLFIDALTAVQVERNASASSSELVSQFARVGPKAVRGRRRMPGLM